MVAFFFGYIEVDDNYYHSIKAVEHDRAKKGGGSLRFFLHLRTRFMNDMIIVLTRSGLSLNLTLKTFLFYS